MANMNSCTIEHRLKFHKVVRQDIWGEVVEFNLAASAVRLWMQKQKNY